MLSGHDHMKIDEHSILVGRFLFVFGLPCEREENSQAHREDFESFHRNSYLVLEVGNNIPRPPEGGFLTVRPSASRWWALTMAAKRKRHWTVEPRA
jgi:hypothetical protein